MTKEQIIGYAKIPLATSFEKKGAGKVEYGSFPVFARVGGFEFSGKKLNRAKKRSKGIARRN